MKLDGLLGRRRVDPRRLRMEIFALGDRHQGDALAGARRELATPHLAAERRQLLTAVVAHLESGGPSGGGAPAGGLAQAAYLGVIVCALLWTMMILSSLTP